MEDGLSQVSVMSILSDDLGQMWFATRHGLNVYNGNNIQQLLMNMNTTKQGFERVRQLCTDFERHIYFLSDEELVAYDKRLNTFRSLKKDVMAICCRDNNLWAAREQDIFLYNEKTRELVPYVSLKDISRKTVVNVLFQDRRSRLWVGTEKALYVVDEFRKETLVLKDVNVKNIYEDRSGYLWISTVENGLIKLSDNIIIKHFRASSSAPNALFSDNVRCVTQDLHGNMWIGTSKGLSKLESSETTFTNYTPQYNNARSLSHHSVTSIHCDSQGTIWVGTYTGGVDYFNPIDQTFSFINIEDRTNRTFSIGNMYPIDEVSVLVSSALGLCIYDMQHKILSTINIPDNPHFTSFTSDSKTGKIYCGTPDAGIYVYDAVHKQTTSERITMDNSALPSNNISGMAFTDGQLYIATNKGFSVYDVERRTSEPFLSDLAISSSTPSVLTIDCKKRLWIGFLSARIMEYNLQTGESVFHDNLLPQKDLDQATRVYRILEDCKRRLWAITSGKGLYQYNEEKEQFELFADATIEWSLNYCFDILEMPDGQLAIFTSNGVSFLNPDNKTFTHLYREHFVGGSILNEGCGNYVDRNFNLLIGTLDGIVCCNYHDIAKAPVSDKLIFSRLFVDSEEVFPNQDGEIINQMLPYVSEIHIQSRYRSFDVEVSNMDYLRLDNAHLEYMLEGFDDTWNKTGQNRIHYTNINPGKYILKVKSPQDGAGKYEEIKMLITVHPPFYASVWAFICYFCMLCLFVFFAFRIRDARRRLQLELEYEQREKLRIENLNKERIKFYINLSHELLTPVSLIMAQIETLVIDCKELSLPIRTRINRIYKNTDLLHILIKGILDFRKNEYQRENFNISQDNVVPILENIINSFKDKARIQGLKLDLIVDSQDIRLFVDKEAFQKVITNLLSNAFKFTPAGGNVSVSCKRRQNTILIEVSDTGAGIPEGAMEKIFDRFYQVSDSKSQEGAGIGLSYVKDIIKQHGGTVSVRNNTSKGCTFSLEFKEGYGHIPLLEQNREVTTDVFPISMDEDSSAKEPSYVEEEGRNRILIVEDNEEMLALLVHAFQPLYYVCQAHSAEEALTVLQSFIPDIILSDVMMGHISGIELCAMVKQNYDTCHIPFVLLTASTVEENYIAGLQNGVDDYIAKPFKVEYLILRCNSLINNRKILKNKFANQISNEPQTFATNKIDMEFIHKAQEIIERNLDNINFSTDEFAQEMAISRAKLYSKIKSITGMTVKEFILNIKLKKAADYLVNRDDLLIADIAYKLGFNSARLFSQSFKDLFGDTPVNYRKNKQRE